VLVLVVLFGGAVLGAIKQSVEPPLGGGVGSWRLDTWSALLKDPTFGDAVVFSAKVTLLASALSAILALAVAGPLRRRGATLRTVFSLPVPVPHLLVAIVAVIWLAPGGLADRVFGALPISLVRDHGGFGIVFVYVYKETPFLVLLLLTVMGTGLRQREEAAAVLGAGRLAQLRWVLWPAVRRPLLLGTMVVAAFVFGAFEVPLTIGPNYPPTVATYAFEATQTDALVGSSRASAALLVAAAASVVLALFAVRFARGEDA